MFDELLGRVEINPAVMLGKPVIRGTRLTVEIILEKLAAGRTVEEVEKTTHSWLEKTFWPLSPTRVTPSAPTN